MGEESGATLSVRTDDYEYCSMYSCVHSRVHSSLLQQQADDHFTWDILVLCGVFVAMFGGCISMSIAKNCRKQNCKNYFSANEIRMWSCPLWACGVLMFVLGLLGAIDRSEVSTGCINKSKPSVSSRLPLTIYYYKRRNYDTKLLASRTLRFWRRS